MLKLTRNGVPNQVRVLSLIVAAVLASGCSGGLLELTPPGETAGTAQTAGAETPADEASKQALTVITEARKLKASGKQKEALALLEKNSRGDNADRAILVERGFMHLEGGQPDKAKVVLQQVVTADKDKKDWRVLSGIGVALASQNRPKEAQKFFAKALEASPGNPAVLNNIAMAHMLDRKLGEAETVLRSAMTGKSFPPEITRNLALAQALQSQSAASKSPSATN